MSTTPEREALADEMSDIGSGIGWHCWNCKWRGKEESDAAKHADENDGHRVTRSSETWHGHPPNPSGAGEVTRWSATPEREALLRALFKAFQTCRHQLAFCGSCVDDALASLLPTGEAVTLPTLEEEPRNIMDDLAPVEPYTLPKPNRRSSLAPRHSGDAAPGEDTERERFVQTIMDALDPRLIDRSAHRAEAEAMAAMLVYRGFGDVSEARAALADRTAERDALAIDHRRITAELDDVCVERAELREALAAVEALCEEGPGSPLSPHYGYVSLRRLRAALAPSGAAENVDEP